MSNGSTYLRLEVISGNATGDTIVVEDELVIGRHAEGPGRLSEDEEISRQHARVSREATGDYAIEDLGSSNGTFVNGLQIQSPRLLALEDSIEVGATTLLVKAIVRPEPVQTPAAAAPPVPDRHSPTVFARSPVVAPPAGPAQQSAPGRAPDTSPESAPPNAPTPAPAGPSIPPPAFKRPAGDITLPPAPASPSTPPPASERPAGDVAPPPAPAAPSTPPPMPERPAGDVTPPPKPAPPAIEIPPLALKLEVDFEARQARITLGDSGAAVDMVFKDGSWRAALAGPDRER